MDNREVYVAPSERLIEGEEFQKVVDTPAEPQPERQLSLEEVIAGLRGFGIEDNEEILTFTSREGKKVRLRITNLPTDDEIKALLSTEELKGYAWIQKVRVEIISRSISWIDGIDIRSLREKKTIVKDADGVNRDIQVVLRNIIMGWGQELVMTLWKIAMVHSDRLEKRYQSEFPDSVIMTDVEKRFMETVLKEIEDTSREIIEESVQQMFDPGDLDK